MTWIVGRSTLFGYAAGISDICVTLADRTERDCLQKVYPVGRFMAMGFAGSVQIGFKMVTRLADLLKTDDLEMAWLPEAVIDWWPADSREVFRNFEQSERGLGCELILLSAHPNENAGDVPWAKCFVHRFREPDFEPVLAGSNEVVSIGYGSGFEPYLDVLQSAAKNFAHLQMEVGNPGGAAYGLMTAVRTAIEGNPVPGISRHLQICLVRRGEIGIHHFNRHFFGKPDGDLVMPPLARSSQELAKMLESAGLTAAGARC